MPIYSEIDKKDNEDTSIVVDVDLEAGEASTAAEEEVAVLKNDGGEDDIESVSSVEKKVDKVFSAQSIEMSEKFKESLKEMFEKDPDLKAKNVKLTNYEIVEEFKRSCVVNAYLSFDFHVDDGEDYSGEKLSLYNQYKRKSGNKKVKLFTHFDALSVESSIDTVIELLYEQFTENLKIFWQLNNMCEDEVNVKFCYEDSTEEVNDATISKHTLQVRIEHAERLISSTNDYLYSKDMGLVHRLISLAVSFFQLGCLVSIITTNLVSGEVNGLTSSIAVFLFIVPSVVVYLSIMMSELLSDFFYDGLDDLFASECYTFVKILNIYMMPLLMLIYMLILLPLLACGFTNWRDWDIDMQIAGTIEMCLVITTVFATCVVLVNDPQPLSILFNFAGIAVVLEFDDKIATFLNYTEPVNKLYVKDPPKKVNKDNKMSSKAVVAICIAVPVFVYIYVNLLM